MSDAAWRGRVVAGRFRLDERIGRGGYGEVYRARQLSVDRDVALKLVHVHLQDHPEVRARFEREARLASRLRHANAVRIIDFGDDGDALFLAMEYVDGPTLKQAMRSAALDATEVIGVLRGVASALDAAHAEGLVHRDLKPSNVMLPEGPDGLRPVVIDFGLVKAFDGDGDDDLTRSNMLVGTPAYLSPEAVAGGAVDHRADLYSLGVMAYELLAGRKPVQGSSAVDTAMAHLRGDIDPLEQHADVSPELSELVHALLAVEPDERPESAAEVVRRLDAALEPERGDRTETVEWEADAEDRTRMPMRGPASRSSPTRATAPAEATGTPARRAPLAVALAVAAVLAAALGVAVNLERATPGEPADALPGDIPSVDEAAPLVQAAAAAAPASALAQEPALGQEPAPEQEPALGQEPAPEQEPAAASVATATAAPEPAAVDEIAAVAEAREPADEPAAGSASRRRPEASAPPTSTPSARPPREADRTASARAAPEPERRTAPDEAPGTVTVNVSPWGEVWIDGERVGEAPVRSFALAPGDHVVETRYADQSRVERVHVRSGDHVPVTHRFAIR